MFRSLVLAACALLAGCGAHVQTSSGGDYLARPGQVPDPEIARAANVEPDLRFPARIGIARLMDGRLSAPGPGETAEMAAFAERNRRYGEFVPVSPLVADMVGASNTKDSVGGIRLAAARQHLDYVLIYEVGAQARTENTPFALADITIVGGAVLPTRNIVATGTGQAMLVDVRNGYPYGTVMESVDVSGLGTSFGSGNRRSTLREAAVQDVVRALVPAMEEMFEKLDRQG